MQSERISELNLIIISEDERNKEISSIQNTIYDILENREFGNKESFYRQPFASTRLSKKRWRINAVNNAPKITNRIVSRLNLPEIMSDSNKTSVKSANNVYNCIHDLNNLSNSFNKVNLNDVSMLEWKI